MTDTQYTEFNEPRVLVIDRSRTLADELREAFEDDDGLQVDGPEIVHLARTTQAVDVIAEEGPWDAIVAGPSEASRTGLRRLAEVRAHAPDLGVLAAVNGTEPADVQTLVRARPDELIRLPMGADQLAGALRSTIDAARTRREQHAPTPAPAPAPAPEPTPQRTGRVLTVGGPTGGCGKTTLAINLASLLARKTDRRVVLVDLDLQFGEVTAALQLRPPHTIYDLLFDEADRPLEADEVAESLDGSLTATAAGFEVLAAPRDPAQADMITTEQVEMLLDVMRGQADEVIVDTPTGLREQTVTALDLADHLVAVTQVDVPGVANMRSYLDTVDQLGLGSERRTVVLNKELAESGVSGDDAREVLGPVAGSLPFTPGVMRALNSGRPFCEVEPDHETTKALHAALAELLPEELAVAPPEQPGGIRGWWRRQTQQTPQGRK